MLLDKKKLDEAEYQSKTASLDSQIRNLQDDDYLDLTTEIAKKKSVACWRLHQKLLKSMRNSAKYPVFPEDPNRYVFNLTDRKLTETELEVLSLGPKFCIAPKKTNLIEEEDNLEVFFDQLDNGQHIIEGSRGALRADLVSTFDQYQKTGISETLVNNNHKLALKALKEDVDLLIQTPDKGSGIVIMQRAQYNSEMERLLADDTKFTSINAKQVNLSRIESEVSTLIHEIHQCGAITKNEAWLLKPRGSAVPRLYGLPKIHKLTDHTSVPISVPTRPILSMVNSPYHALAKWLCMILSPIRDELCRHTVKSSFQFTDLIRELDLTHQKMLSFDVTSLFTNVPLQETIDFICDKISASPSPFPISTDLLKRALRKCTLNVPYVFNERQYQQTDGVAMGSPLGPLLAAMFMAKLESTTLSGLINSCKCYFRYVDDTFVVCKRRTSLRQLQNCLYSSHPSIRFTIEEESNNRLPFLDVEVIRTNQDRVDTRIFHKKTWSGQYVNFYSYVPTTIKRNLVRNLANRIECISSVNYKEQDLKIETDALRSNGYPKSFIDHNLQPHRTTTLSDNTSLTKIVRRLQFRGDAASELLQRKIQRTVAQKCNDVYPVFVFTSRTLISTQVKDNIPVMSISNIVYRFTCCCQAQFIGMTERYLSDRIKEHVPRWLLSQSDKEPRSSITEHLQKEGHQVNRSSCFSILYKARHRRLLNFVEAVAIRRFKPTIIVQRDYDYRLKLPWT